MSSRTTRGENRGHIWTVSVPSETVRPAGEEQIGGQWAIGTAVGPDVRLEGRIGGHKSPLVVCTLLLPWLIGSSLEALSSCQCHDMMAAETKQYCGRRSL